MDSLSKFDSLFADQPVDCHHAVLFRLVDDLNLLDPLNLLCQVLVALRSQFDQLGTVWALEGGIPDVLARLIPLFEKHAGADQYDPTLLLAWLALVRLKAVVLCVSELGSEDVKFGTAQVKLELIFLVIRHLL